MEVNISRTASEAAASSRAPGGAAPIMRWFGSAAFRFCSVMLSRYLRCHPDRGLYSERRDLPFSKSRRSRFLHSRLKPLGRNDRTKNECLDKSTLFTAKRKKLALRRRQILRFFDRAQNDALGNVPNYLNFADPGCQNK